MTTGTPRIAVIGTGPVGRALAAAYVAGGGSVAVVVSRDARRAADVARDVGADRGSTDIRDALAADAALVAVPDRALAEVAARLAGGASSSCVLFHASGALASDALAPSARRAGSLHPLQAFTDAADAARLARAVAGAHWFHEGEGFDEASAMVATWRGTIHRLAPGGKALYHAGASTLSNHAVALFDAALELFAAAGVPRDEAQAPLARLLEGTAANIAATGVPAALTGPIARGDAETVRRHLDAMRKSTPDLVASYVAMARRALVVARAKGSVAAAHADEIERLLGG